ncbi:hypothetical protein [Epilithonimonas lactis]|uniref:Uncharacterized protein n=1 Tax=Epilithonimonas lactis TaxID=421072 RepID=A0A085BIH5_9FLAO|nr:hypothetical protein [Epilithonimonas lactis]KFC22270.1 hypothetical protein IO89_10030 [Epilithonimonas lactis]SEQ59986.1 hypothetical protein SAMN04488097_2626 [Epilithonimonas lactis]
MISYNVSISDEKKYFFQKFLESIGANYDKKQDDFKLSEEQKKVLDERLKSDKKDFVPAKEALNKLREKYELWDIF